MRLLDRVAYRDDGSLRPNALVRAAGVFRWGALAWLFVLVASGIPQFARPVDGWVVLLVAGAWTAGLSYVRPNWSLWLLAADLGLAAALLVVDVRTGHFATIYPLAAALTWAAVRGFRQGLLAGGVLSAVLICTHVAGGLPLLPMGADAMYVISDAFTILLAAAGVGVVSSLLARSATELTLAQAEEVAAREAAARLAERDALGRELHDSVLQSLTLIHKRSREMAAHESVPGAQVGRLAELAAAQESALRDLVVRQPSATAGPASLRERLEAAARQVRDELDVQVSTAQDVRLPAVAVEQLGAAVDQALSNVIRHAGTRGVWVFAETVGDRLTVSVRDDGCGFRFDEEALRAGRRYGLLGSIKGRIEQLGGTLRVDSGEGRGTELEMEIPVSRG